MYPFLKGPKQLLIVGLLWSPLCFWLIFLLNSTIEVTLWEAAVWAVPPMIVNLFICLSTWFLCRITTGRQWHLFKIVLLHSTAAAILVGLWLLLIAVYNLALKVILNRTLWRDLYPEALPVFLAVGLSLYFISILGHYLILAVEKQRRAEKEVLKQQLLASKAELKAVKATIHPHFLFNSLNLLGPLLDRSTERAQTVISQLSEFLLYSLRYGRQELVMLRDEVEHIKNYLGIESIRLGERLKLQMEIDDAALEIPMQPLTLLPLVENSIKHGINQCLQGGSLTISITRKHRWTRIEISNPYETPDKPVQGEGLGLKTIEQRMTSYYRGRARLTKRKTRDTFIVVLDIPPEDGVNDE